MRSALQSTQFNGGFSAMQADAVPASSFLVLPQGQGSAPELELPTKRRERGNLTGGLDDPLIEDPEETRPNARGARSPGRPDELTDGVEGQAEGLRVANELEPMEIRFAVETIAARLASAGGQDPVAVVEPESFHCETRPTSNLTDRHELSAMAVRAVAC